MDAKKLESIGILVSLENQHMASMYGNSIGGVFLKVPENQLDKARMYLQHGSEW